MLLIPLVIAALSSGQALADDPSDGVELGAEVASCETGAAPEDRVVVFESSMPADPPAVRLGMNLELQQRLPGADDFARVATPGFGVWQKSAPRTRGYVVDKKVEALVPGAAYRVVVRYRWYAKGGKVLRTARRTSDACLQPAVKRLPQ